MSDDTGQALVYALMLILPLSALFARRIRLGQAVWMALAWVAIFGVGLVLYGQRDRIAGLFGSARQVKGSEVRVPISRDSHFWVRARIDGVERRMLIDSGATTTMLSRETADAAGLDLSSPFASSVQTANGPVRAVPTRIASFEIEGLRTNDLKAMVSDNPGADIVGMNFLSRLARWRVEDHTLVLSPGT